MMPYWQHAEKIPIRARKVLSIVISFSLNGRKAYESVIIFLCKTELMENSDYFQQDFHKIV